MSKLIIDALIIVEGKGDASYLSSFIDTEILITNGYDLSHFDLDYLKEIKRYKKIIILTDPDEAGRKINAKLLEKMPGAISLNVNYEKCNKNHKHGIAECEKEEIVRILTPYVSEQKYQNKNRYLCCYSLNQEQREKVCNHFHLGKCNNKKMIERLNNLHIEESKVEEFCHGNK